MKRTLIAILAMSGLAMADTYTWKGPEKGKWNNSSNWTNNTQPDNQSYYPQSSQDTAIIGDDKSVVWESDESYFGHCNSITLGKNSTLDLKDPGNIYVSEFAIGEGSRVNWNNNIALGYGANFTIAYGTFTADSYGQFNVSTGQALWYNGHTVTLTGALDATSLSGSGTIKLYTIAGGVVESKVDYSGLTVENAADNFQYTIASDDHSVYITYEASVVPEPTTATLSLLALAGLAARRRRK